MATDAPANKGARWTPDQETWLVENIGRLGISGAASAMERTTGAIVGRLCDIATRELTGGGVGAPRTMEELTADLGISVKMLKDHMARAAAREAAAKERAAARASGSSAGASAGATERRKAVPAKKTEAAAAPAPVARSAPPATLNAEQRRALDLLAAGKSVFLTGAAGTGKSETVRAMVAWAEQAEAPMLVTGTTGAAAVLIGGGTIHSALSIGLAVGSPNELVSRLTSRPNGKKVVAKLKGLRILLIDEVSMLSAELFDKISKYLSIVRGDKAPFGGLQVVLVGDFAQLPPVEGEFAFTAPEWTRLAPAVVQLTEIFRQKGNAAFQQLLQRARLGALTDEDLTALRGCSATTFPEGFEPTRLYALNAMVARHNTASYRALKDEHEKAGRDAGECIYAAQFSSARAKEWAAKAGIDESVTLCVGAQAMLTWNVNADEGLVNGTRGRVVATAPAAVTLRTLVHGDVTIGYNDLGAEDDPGIKVRYLPLKLAYAISIHKSQGATLDCCETDLGESIFEYGQAYTALSRVRDLSSVRITSVRRGSFRVHPDVAKFYAAAAAKAE